MSEFEETIEGPEISDEAINEFIEHGGEKPSYHPILQIWRTVLDNIETQREEKVTPQWANKITANYREIDFADMPEFQGRLFDKLLVLRDVLDAEIGKADHPFESITSPEEDLELFSQHYKNVLREWQVIFLRWEMDWDCTEPYAGAEVAAVSEAYTMIFGSQSRPGITAYLDNIKLEITEADQAETLAVLEAMKEGR